MFWKCVISDEFRVCTLAKLCSMQIDLPEYLFVFHNLKKKKDIASQVLNKLSNLYNSFPAVTDSG